MGLEKLDIKACMPMDESLFLPSTAHSSSPPEPEAPALAPVAAIASALKPVEPAPKSAEQTKMPSLLAGAGAALISAFSARPSSSRRAKPTFGAAPQKKYQQPIITYLRDGKKTELHRNFKKVRSDHTLGFHVISATLEQNGKKPVVRHVVEVTKTDRNGRVTKLVHKHGDDLPWHASRSRWNAPPVVLAPGSSMEFASSRALELPPPSTFGHINPYVSEAIDWPQLPPYYLTADERERLRSSRETVRKRSEMTTTTEEFMNGAKQIYSKLATTNMQYGFWLLGH
jgi:hypothetical protein